MPLGNLRTRPIRPEVAILHNGEVHDVRTYVYDQQGLVGVWTLTGRWIPEDQILDCEPKDGQQ